MKLIKILPCILTAVIMVSIFMFSAQPAKESKKLSDDVIITAVKKITHNENIDTKPAVKKFSEGVRSFAHFLLYLALGISLFWALYENSNKALQSLLIYAIAICLLYAISDEIHQLFVEGRAFQLTDILTDLFGAILGSSILYYFVHGKAKKALVR